MDNLDSITVLPKMNTSAEKDRIFKLIWALDFVTDSSRHYINLAFQNVDTGFVLVDSIPPELLSYCTVGSFFCNGKKISRAPDGVDWGFEIISTEYNHYIEAGEAFSDGDYDLSLAGKSVYSKICKKQPCFVQQVGSVKVVIPCFVIAATYFFKSTSLREAVLSRKLNALYHSCSLNPSGKHAEIYLKPAGNIRDAKEIARMVLDPFARRRVNLCVNHQYATKANTYQRLLVDFPVSQTIPMSARGTYVDYGNGSGTFIVHQILDEGSSYPFNSIDVHYQGNRAIGSIEGQGSYPKPGKKSSRQMTVKSPSSGLVRHLLENREIPFNGNLYTIIENRIVEPAPPAEDTETPYTVFQNDTVDISVQPDHPGDGTVAQGEIQGNDSEREKRFEFSLDLFLDMIVKLRDQKHSIRQGSSEIQISIENFNIYESYVARRNNSGLLTLKESYDNSATNRRRCAFVCFVCLGFNICIIEIDQTGIGNARCSTRVLISNKEIPIWFAEECVRDYVLGSPLEKRVLLAARAGVAFITRKHPQDRREESQILWRTWLLTTISKWSREN